MGNNPNFLSRSTASDVGTQLLAPDVDLSGTTLADFRLLRSLGQGGMGQVYLAEQISLKRPVALKILKADLASDSTSLKRFKAEAEAVARATHANIVQVYAFGEINGLHYMAMEYVEGLNLREYLVKKGPPSLALAVNIMRQVAAALQRAGELGIVHRDIKPENILLTRKGLVKVADFGLSRCFNAQQPASSLTQPGVALGTPLYMSPEQVEGKELDPRSDIYSFGITSFHMLAGDPPFQGQNPFEIALRHVQSEPQELKKVRPDLPANLCAVVHKMMCKQPEGRYQTGRELLKDLNLVRDSLSTSRDSAAPTIALAEIAPAKGARRGLGLATPRHLFVASVAIAMIAGAVVGWTWKRPGTSRGESVASLPSPLEGGESATNLHEQFLLAAVQEYERPSEQSQVGLGVGHCLELAVLYLSQWRLDEADRFFERLINNPANVKVYMVVGRFGHAIVLAFQDKADQSNQVFLQAINESEQAPGRLRFLLNRNPHFLQRVVKALDHNAANLEASNRHLPPGLEQLRRAQPVPAGAQRRGQGTGASPARARNGA
jgi:serine/threonine-protein kinase